MTGQCDDVAREEGVPGIAVRVAEDEGGKGGAGGAAEATVATRASSVEAAAGAAGARTIVVGLISAVLVQPLWSYQVCLVPPLLGRIATKSTLYKPALAFSTVASSWRLFGSLGALEPAFSFAMSCVRITVSMTYVHHIPLSGSMFAYL